MQKFVSGIKEHNYNKQVIKFTEKQTNFTFLLYTKCKQKQTNMAIETAI